MPSPRALAEERTNVKRLAGRYLVLALVALSVGTAIYAAVSRATAGSAKALPTRPLRPALGAAHTTRARATPTAAMFAETVETLGNTYATVHHDARRLENADCVQASPGHYMCSYLLTSPNRPAQCHLIQARWTPERASTITVTLGSRVLRCGTLKEALRSLR